MDDYARVEDQFHWDRFSSTGSSISVSRLQALLTDFVISILRSGGDMDEHAVQQRSEQRQLAFGTTTRKNSVLGKSSTGTRTQGDGIRIRSVTNYTIEPLNCHTKLETL